VHEEELNVLGVVDEESLVAGGHHVAGLLVGTVTDGGHGHLALEAAADGIINTLGLAPALANTLEAVGLVAVEAVGAYSSRCQSSDRTFVSSWPPWPEKYRPSIRNKLSSSPAILPLVECSSFFLFPRWACLHVDD
jgi:hypothetical protein